MKFVFLLLSLLVTGCSAKPKILNADQAFSSTSVAYPSHTGMTSVSLDYTTENNDFLHFAVIKEKDQSIVSGLQVTFNLPDWEFLDTCLLPNGDAIDCVRADSDVKECNRYGCHLTEKLSASISKALYERFATDRLSIKFVGKRGAQIVEVPGFVIQGFLNKVNATFPEWQ